MAKRLITTQIGSLPFTDVDEAISYSLQHDIPFLPELPASGDSMLDYIKEPGRLSCLEKFKSNQFDTVKVQCVGPTTLILSGYSEDDAIARCYAHISAILDGLKARETILFLDEPALGQVGFDFASVWSALFESFDVISGVHTCGNMDWDKMLSSSVDIISFDASQFDITKYTKYRSGKRMAWGVVSGEGVRDYKEGDLVTLPCGIGSRLFKSEDCAGKLDDLNRIASGIERS